MIADRMIVPIDLNHPAKQQIQSGDQYHENRQLPELDAKVEGQREVTKIRSGKLERLPEGIRKTEAMNEAKTKCQDPPPSDIAANDIFERHINNRKSR